MWFSVQRKERKLCKQPFLTKVVPMISDMGDVCDEDLQKKMLKKY